MTTRDQVRVSSRIEPLAASLGRRVGRRSVVAGLAGLGVAGAGAMRTSRLLDDDDGRAIAAPSVAPRLTKQGQESPLPDGMALVSSPRVPVFGVGGADLAGLLSGQMVNWGDVGSAVGIEVVPLALEGQVPDGAQPAETVADYEALVEAFRERPGGVALVPVDQVDFRVNVLAVDGFDPLRDGQSDELIRIGVVGDIVPGRNVHNKMVFYGDFTHPFLKVAEELNRFDLAFANMEGNLSPNIPPPEDAHTFSFVSDPAMIDGLKLAGIDAVSLANNHSTWNSAGWGVSALIDTIDSLAAAELAYFGGGRTLDEARAPWVSEVKGKRVAVIGIDGVTANEEAREPDATVNETWLGASLYAGAGPEQPGTNPYAVDQFLGDIEALAAEYDIVIPYFHFGREYIAVPPPWAVEGARAAIDAGATMVVTNHPHVIQGMEIYDNRPIVYSPGNFIFDQMFSVEVRTGLILEIVIKGDRVVGLRPKGIEIEDFNQPRLMSAGEHAALMDRFWSATDRLAGRE